MLAGLRPLAFSPIGVARRPLPKEAVVKDITCFISYTWNSWQKDFAQAFATELRKNRDFEVWIDREQVLPGQSLYTRLAEGLRRESDCAISESVNDFETPVVRI